MAIWSATHFIRVAVVLPVVFPEADSADFEASALTECLEATARASMGQITNGRHVAE
jgi:hypothetical protein